MKKIISLFLGIMMVTGMCVTPVKAQCDGHDERYRVIKKTSTTCQYEIVCDLCGDVLQAAKTEKHFFSAPQIESVSKSYHHTFRECEHCGYKKKTVGKHKFVRTIDPDVNSPEKISSKKHHQLYECSVCGKDKWKDEAHNFKPTSTLATPYSKKYHEKEYACPCGQTTIKKVKHKYVVNEEKDPEKIDKNYHKVFYICECGKETTRKVKHKYINGLAANYEDHEDHKYHQRYYDCKCGHFIIKKEKHEIVWSGNDIEAHQDCFCGYVGPNALSSTTTMPLKKKSTVVVPISSTVNDIISGIEKNESDAFYKISRYSTSAVTIVPSKCTYLSFTIYYRSGIHKVYKVNFE